MSFKREIHCNVDVNVVNDVDYNLLTKRIKIANNLIEVNFNLMMNIKGLNRIKGIFKNLMSEIKTYLKREMITIITEDLCSYLQYNLKLSIWLNSK